MMYSRDDYIEVLGFEIRDVYIPGPEWRIHEFKEVIIRTEIGAFSLGGKPSWNVSDIPRRIRLVSLGYAPRPVGFSFPSRSGCICVAMLDDGLNAFCGPRVAIGAFGETDPNHQAIARDLLETLARSGLPAAIEHAKAAGIEEIWRRPVRWPALDDFKEFR